MAVRFVSNIPDVIRRIDRQILQNHKAVGLVAQRQAKKNVHPGGLGGFKSAHSSGLSGSIGYEANQLGDETVTRFGSGMKYAAIHERGGWIYAKSGGALAIPIHKDAKKAKSPLEFTDLHLIKREGRPSLLVRMIGSAKKDRRKKRWDLMYVLAPSVYIPQRSYLRPVLAQQYREIIKLLSRPPRGMKSEFISA